MDEAIRTAAISPLRQRLIDDYEHAPVLARDAAQLHSGRGSLRDIPRAFTRYSDGG